MTERLDPDSLRCAEPVPPPAKPHRGFTLLYELFFVVLAVEFGIDGASVGMAWVYARQFAPDDINTQALSLAAALVLCIFEAARIPCAFALRTETSATIKAFCVLGILASAPITVFNLSQLLNIPAQARLNAVHDTGAALASAKDRAAAFTDRQKLAREEIDRAERIFHEASARAQSGNGDLASLPKACWQGRCAKDSREKDLRENSKEARAEVSNASKQLDKARQALLATDGAKITAELRAAEGEHTKAIAASPLHRYAAMVFGGEPSAISDTVMAWTVRLFVGVPAGLGAFLAALLTMIAVRPVPRPAPVKARSAEQIELLKAGASEIRRSASAAVVADVTQEFKAASADAKAAPANGDAPKSPMGEALRDFLAKAKRPRGRPRKDKSNGAAAPAKTTKPRKPPPAPDGGNPPPN